MHTWLPDAHVEAPTAGSIILASVLLKMGTYGLMRFNLPIFPDVSRELAPYMMTLAVIGIVYGALVAMVQPDMKKLVAYSSVSHLGFVVLGIFAFTEISLQGALYQMLNHGISTGALFLCVGNYLRAAAHARDCGVWRSVDTNASLFDSVHDHFALEHWLPLLNGFIGELLILVGTFSSTVPFARTFAVIGTSGVILSAVYLLWMLQRVLFGETDKLAKQKLEDLDGREKSGACTARWRWRS